MLITIASFLGMAVAARQLSYTMSTFEILSFRSLIGIIVLLPLVLRRGGTVLHTHQLMLHFWRNLVHFGGQFGWVLGVALLPLAEVFALEFTTPIWVALLAAVFLHERLSAHRIIVVVLGFIGVIVILRPGVDVIQPAAFVVLGAAMLFAGSVVMVKILTRRDAPLAVIFYMSVMQLPMGLIPALFDWTVPAWSDMPLFIIVGVTAVSAHYAMARALMVADASVIFPIDFLRLPAVAVLGYLVYAERIDLWTFIGAAIIFAANYYSILRESRITRPDSDSKRTA
jgi:S-adenosylmethionine uptake transporter